MMNPGSWIVRSPLRRPALAVAAISLLAGCGRNEVKVYRVEKDHDAAPPMQQQAEAPAGHPDVGSPAKPQLSWTLPGGWEQQAPGEMRAASFSIKGKDGKQADVSVIPLGGDAGGDFANVNRWRGQVAQQPISPEELAKLAESVHVGSDPADLYDISGQNPSSGDATRILATILHRDGTAWFFKMTGDDALVEQQKLAFIEFLKSVRFQAADTAALPPSHPPIDGMTLSPGMAGDTASSADHPGWQVPAGWRQAPAGQFLMAKFIVGGEGGAQAAVNVSNSAGDGGGLAANVNRWRKQLGLGEMSDQDVNQSATPADIPGGKAMFVDLTGTDARTGQPAGLVGAIVPQGGQTWFYKLMGDAKVVEAQKSAFTQFVQTVKY
jgi:hypothetical protein